MHESGLVYLDTFESVGEQEHQDQVERSGNRNQLQKIAKVIMRLSVARGLEPVGVLGQQCQPGPNTNDSMKMLTIRTFAMVTLLLLAMCFGAWFVWRKWKSLTKNLNNVQEQLDYHYEYAAWLCERLDTSGWMMDEGNSMSERMNNLHARLTVFEENICEGLNTLDDATDCIRYGLMEFGGFVRETALSATQRNQMYIQERANFVIWRHKQNMADTTDVPREGALEGGEEDDPTEDEPVTPETGMQNLWDRIKVRALAQELWYEAAQMQQAVIILLDACSGNPPTGMTMEVIQSLRGVFQRLYRYSRNRGGGVMADVY